MSLVYSFGNLSPKILRKLIQELDELTKDPPEGIQVHSNEHELTNIQATVEGPAETPYAGGIFRVRLVLGSDYPAVPPKAFFITKIFHPNVAKTGEICVNTLKQEWKSSLGIKHILLTIKCLLIVPNPESALNEEAGKLLLEHYEDYSHRAMLMTEIHCQPVHVKSIEQCSTTGVKKNNGNKYLKDKKRYLKRL